MSSLSLPHLLDPLAWGFGHYRTFDMTQALQLMHECWPAILTIVASYLGMIVLVSTRSITGTCFTPSKNTNSRHPDHRLKTARQLWNTMLTVVSLLGSLHVVTHLASSMLTRGVYVTLTEHDPSFFQGPTGFWLLLFVLFKIVELGDTVFLILSSSHIQTKPPSFLHWFHHSTVLPWCWYELQAQTPMHHCCMALNYTVHTFMYGYFALNDTFDDAAFRRRNGMRITALQCLQFVLDLLVISVAAYDRFVQRPSTSPTTVVSLVLSSTIISTYLVLFLQFAEEKYGVYSQIRHALYQRSQRRAASSSRSSSTNGNATTGTSSSNNNNMPWHRTDLTLDQRFDEAAKMAVMLSYVASNDDLLTLYGAYKVVRDGPLPAELLAESESPSSEPNSSDDLRGRAKFNAWKQASGWSKQQAQLQYIAMLDELSERSNQIQQQRKNQTPATQANGPTAAVSDPYIMYPVRIAGHGAYHPKRIVYNHEVEARGGFTLSSQEKKRTGVTERRWVDIDGGENLLQNGASAIRSACANANITVEDIDLIVGSFGGHQFLPDDAALVQRELGLGESGTRAFTVHATCLSFFVALDVAGSFIRDGRYRNVAVFASSIASVGLNAQDPHSAGLFGDGAAAVILQPSSQSSSDGGSAIHRVHMETYGIGADACKIEGAGTFRPTHHPKWEPIMDRFQMDGEATLGIISKYVRGVLMRAMPGLESGLIGVQLPGYDKPIDIDWVIPHQASAVGIDSMGMFGWSDKKVLRTLHKFGNTIAASIPLTLCDHIDNGTIKRGDKILLCGTSAGLSFGAMLLTY
jgi:3-oxoacyl-[acyl-carrier-protein] synthase III